MSLINYTNIEDNTPINANVFNERFGNVIEVVNGKLDATNFAAGGIPVDALSNAVFERMWPVGSVYINATNNTNPSSLLGFGTWVQFGAGRALVGIDTGQAEFNAPEKLGGHKELQSHNHTGSTSVSGNHTHGMPGDVVYTSASGTARAGGSGQQFRWSVGGPLAAGDHTHSFTTNSTGGGNAGNLQPYITVYLWKRTG